MIAEQIFRSPRTTAAHLRAQIEESVPIDAVFSVKIEDYNERRAVSELVNEQYPRYEMVAFYTDSVQLRRMA